MAIALPPPMVRPGTGDALVQERGTAYSAASGTLGESVSIGQAELVRSYSLLIPQDDVARISAQIRGWAFSLEIKFENVEGEEPRLQLAARRDDAVTLVFLNWNSRFGISLTTPLEIAYLRDESKILLLATNQAFGGMNRLELQLLLQEKS